MKLSFSEIKSWEDFEDLTAAYFTQLKDDKKYNIIDVFVEQSGKGGDGGRDILITFLINDPIKPVERKWVVQCKFYNTAVSAKQLATVNIPSIIHQYGADGYLLICKDDVAISTTNMFEGFRRECSFCYQYIIWKGPAFLNMLYEMPALHQHYFPEFFKKMKKKEIESGNKQKKYLI